MQKYGMMLNIRIFIIASAVLTVTLMSSHDAYGATLTWSSFSNVTAPVGFDIWSGAPLPGFPNSPTQFEVSDPALAGNGKTDHINVLVNSTSDPTGITLTLTEVGDTGHFFNTNLVFTNETGKFGISSTETIGISGYGLNTDPTRIDHVISGPDNLNSGIQVVSSSDTNGIYMNLTETGPNTGIFTNTLHFTTGPSINGSTISVQPGQIVTIVDVFTEFNGGANFDDSDVELITPDNDPAMGVLPAKYLDTIDVTYGNTRISGVIDLTTDPGGGGGGLIQPGLVLDAPLGFGNYAVLHPPSIGNDYRNPYGGGVMINGKPFDVKNYTTKIPQQVLKIGKPSTFAFKIYDERGAYTVSDVGMYFHFKGDPAVIDADTWVLWDKSRGLITHDPNKIFAKTSSDDIINGNYLDLTFTLTPQKPMPDSSLIMRMWDTKLSMGDVPIWGAIIIVDPNAPIPIKKIPTDQYGDYVKLEQILDKDGYYVPKLLNKMHCLPEVYHSIDVNWVYDKGVDKLTMIESDKSGTVLGAITVSLFKKESQPPITDHNYFDFTTQQLYRQNVDQEETAKLEEGQKAMKLLESMGIVRQNNFVNFK